MEPQEKREASWRSTILQAGGPFFIIWNPDYADPPTVTFASRKEAEEAALNMAKRHAPHRFFVCRAESCAAIEELPVTLSKLKGDK